MFQRYYEWRKKNHKIWPLKVYSNLKLTYNGYRGGRHDWWPLHKAHSQGSTACNGFAQVRSENLVPGLLHAQVKTPSWYRFTILSLIVPSYFYSWSLRAFIEVANRNNYIKKLPKYLLLFSFMAKMITELSTRNMEQNLKTVKNLAKLNTWITKFHNLVTLSKVNCCLPMFMGLDFLENFDLTCLLVSNRSWSQGVLSRTETWSMIYTYLRWGNQGSEVNQTSKYFAIYRF